MKSSKRFLVCMAFLIGSSTASAQVALTGTSYHQDFNSLASGLPTGWTIYTSATLSGLGWVGSFTNSPTNWNGSTDGNGNFRNSAAYNTANRGTGSGVGSQAVYTDRAFGWRASNGETSRAALTVVFENTLGLENFEVSVDLFTGNGTGGTLTVDLEYRVGGTGNFSSVGSYTTAGGSQVSEVISLSVSGQVLASLNAQSEQVYFRVRGTASSSNETHTLVVDNFSLTYSPIPEPGAFGFLLGGVVLVAVVVRRGPRREPASERN